MEQNLSIIYGYVKNIAFLRFLAILHMAVVLPLHWLAGHCELLLKWKFDVVDMRDVVDLMDKVFTKF